MTEVPENPTSYRGFEVAERRHVYRSDWCALRRDVVVLPNGEHQEYHVFEIGDAVSVTPFLPDGSVLMIGQYRYPHGKTHWETPAGRIDANETPEEAARRELREETGYEAGRLVPLPGFYPTNGISAHYAHSFCALDCVKVGEPELDASEVMNVRVFSRAECDALLAAGRIEDAFTALGLLYADRLVREPG